MYEKINYVEFPAANIAAVKAFFVAVFGWKFTDYGEIHILAKAIRLLAKAIRLFSPVRI